MTTNIVITDLGVSILTHIDKLDRSTISVNSGIDIRLKDKFIRVEDFRGSKPNIPIRIFDEQDEAE